MTKSHEPASAQSVALAAASGSSAAAAQVAPGPPVSEVDERRFAENMRRLRESAGWSQGELARRLQHAGWETFHQTTVSRIEKGERPIRLGEARAIAQLFGAQVLDLLEPVEELALGDELLGARIRALWSFDEIRRATDELLGHCEALERVVAKARLQGVDPNGSDDPSGYVKSLGAVFRKAEEALEQFTPEEAVRSSRMEHERRRA